MLSIVRVRHPWLHGELYSAEDDLTTEELARVAAATAEALRGAREAARELGADWALIGGQALVAYGVPRITTDVDILASLAGELALALAAQGWAPLRFDAGSGDYVVAEEVTAHYMDDPVLFDVGEQRVMFPLRSPGGMIVELLTAQHPVEREMLELAAPRKVFGSPIPVAPLGGVLLVKVKADRPKDRAAVEQAAEFLPAELLRAAIEWARLRDPSTAEDLEALVRESRARRQPARTEPFRPKRRR
jgi:hypothetical protein